MSTSAQIEANRRNAAASTGPTTPAGKFKSSGNAVSRGLFSTRAVLNPEDAIEFNQLAEGMRKDLAPEGTLELTLASEIIRAAWRLRRCARVEDGLFQAGMVRPYPFDSSGADDCPGQLDPMANPETARTQLSVDRARLESHRILKRSMDELRRLQNERRFRMEILPDGFNTHDLGLASCKDLMSAMATEKRCQLLIRQTVTAPPPPAAEVKKQTQSPEAASTKRSQSAPDTIQNAVPRNAPCPCGSGQKYKRCCGKDAPAVLHGGLQIGQKMAA